MTTSRVLVFTGSLRRDSYNRMVAESLPARAPDGLAFDYFDRLADIPYYDEDLDTETPPPIVVELRAKVVAADALFWVTPEFNHTIPGLVKNTFEWLSHPLSKAVLIGKISAIAVCTQGRGGYRGMADMARILRDIGGFVLCTPEVCIQHAHKVVSRSEDGTVLLSDPLAEKLLGLQLRSLQKAIHDRAGDIAGAPWRDALAGAAIPQPKPA